MFYSRGLEAKPPTRRLAPVRPLYVSYMNNVEDASYVYKGGTVNRNKLWFISFPWEMLVPFRLP